MGTTAIKMLVFIAARATLNQPTSIEDLRRKFDVSHNAAKQALAIFRRRTLQIKAEKNAKYWAEKGEKHFIEYYGKLFCE